MNVRVNIQRDYDYMGGGWSDTPKTDREQSKKLLLDTIMKKCDITENDLDNISVVKSKLRDFKLNDILETETSFWKKLF
jgi:hypothetical protein